MIAVIDYGAGNLGSVYKALRAANGEAEVTRDPETIRRADGLVLPGVGAFTHCMNGLASAGLVEPTLAYLATGRPFLGICVGLQMLFDASDEMGMSPGLGVLRGRVVRFAFDGENADLKIPHIGWNSIDFRPDAPLFAGLHPGDRVYFVHSFYPVPDDPSIVTATSEYGYRFCAAIQVGNVHATQFHPEKSGAVGLRILRNFAALCT
jgi:glutamine amidotransferase